MELVIVKKVREHLDKYDDLFNHSQHGFIEGNKHDEVLSKVYEVMNEGEMVKVMTSLT